MNAICGDFYSKSAFVVWVGPAAAEPLTSIPLSVHLQANSCGFNTIPINADKVFIFSMVSHSLNYFDFRVGMFVVCVGAEPTTPLSWHVPRCNPLGNQHQRQNPKTHALTKIIPSNWVPTKQHCASDLALTKT